MKPWDYYESTIPYAPIREIKDRLRAEIDAQPLTRDQRQAEHDRVPERATLIYKEANEPRARDQATLEAEFWSDCREDIGYDSFLTEEGCGILEAKAMEDGHSAGRGNVYCVLSTLSDFVETIIQHARHKAE